MIDQEAAEKASQYLVDTAFAYGASRARMFKADKMLNHVRSVVFIHSGATTAAAREAEAYASPEYLAAIEELRAATEEAEKLKAAREAAEVRVDLWRTISARQRGA
jgi:alpha-ketoglutarate-dependent taurine dioxygenase